MKNVLYPDEFPIDDFLRGFREAPEEDYVTRIKKLYSLLEKNGLAATIWESKVDLDDNPINMLNIPDEIKRMITGFTMDKSDTPHDLICDWCSPLYLDFEQLSAKDMVGFRANASQLRLDSEYRELPRHKLPLSELSVTERSVHHCTEVLSPVVNQVLPDCPKLWELPDDIIQVPVFHTFQIDGANEVSAMRVAVMFIDQNKILAINDRLNDALEVMQDIFDARGDMNILSRYISYLEVDLIPDDLLWDCEDVLAGTCDSVSSQSVEVDFTRPENLGIAI